MSESHDRTKCLELAERLSEYLDGELPEETRREVEAHFTDCATCERFLDSLRRTKECGRLLQAIELLPERLAAIRRDLETRLQNP